MMSPVTSSPVSSHPDFVTMNEEDNNNSEDTESAESISSADLYFRKADFRNELESILSLGFQLRNHACQFQSFEEYETTETITENIRRGKRKIQHLGESSTHSLKTKQRNVLASGGIIVKKKPPDDDITHTFRVVTTEDKRDQHAEDHWIYRPLLDGSTSTTIYSWPDPHPFLFHSLKDLDSYYEDEHGDQMYGLANFSKPQTLFTIKQQTSNSYPQNKLMDEILDDMIHQAWDTAVHLVDSVVPCCDLETQPHISAQDLLHIQTNYLEDANDLFLNMNIPCRPDKYIDTDGLSWFQCKTCTLPAFTSHEEWAAHFYSPFDGPYQTHKEGCGMRLFKQRRVSMVQSMLHKEALFIMDGILHVLFAQVKTMMENEQLKSPHDLHWRHVLQLFQHVLGDTKGWNEDMVHETLLVHPDFVPITLNQHVLTTAKLRIVERYAKFDVIL